mmetsp:Transcript_49790/g.129762  ORF Transcript_49790/g.129762 Transcript_49790/m.129762 type:complete len:87 (+) Transcript_49790:323-583(+)
MRAVSCTHCATARVQLQSSDPSSSRNLEAANLQCMNLADYPYFFFAFFFCVFEFPNCIQAIAPIQHTTHHTIATCKANACCSRVKR